MYSLSLVIPNHNGERVIEDSIRAYHNEFSKKFKNFEIIVVCNACTDNSVKVCNSLSAEFPLKIVEIPKRGKGYALVEGFSQARFDLIGFLDADNPFDLKEVSNMIDKLENYDVAIASKYLRGKAKIQDSMMRRLLSLGGSAVTRLLFGMNFRDTQAGAKFFRKEVWRKIDKNFISTGFDFDIEFLYKVKEAGFSIIESYIPFKYEKFSTVRLKYLPGMLARLLKLRVLK